MKRLFKGRDKDKEKEKEKGKHSVEEKSLGI
jgi:hypothetical protein